MTKSTIADWDTTAGNNTDVGGISLAENVMKWQAVNNAMREMMAQTAGLYAQLPVNAALAGCDMTGTTDCAADFQALVTASAGRTIYIPKGTLRLDSTITIPSNTHLRFDGTAIDFRGTASNVFEADGTSARISNIRIEGAVCTMQDAGAGDQLEGHFFFGRRVSKVRLNRITVNVGKLIRTELRSTFPTRTVDSVTIPDFTSGTIGSGSAAETFMASELNFDIRVNDFELNGTAGVSDASTTAAAIFIKFCTNWSVRRGNIFICRSGVLGWGGDANPNRDGGAGVKRWCRRGVVEGVNVYDATGSAIWFGQTADCSGVSCYAENAGDFGMHTEGCLNVTWTACHAYNCVRGMGWYFIDEACDFIGCHILTDDPANTIGSEGFVVVAKHNMGFDSDAPSGQFIGGSIRVRGTGGTVANFGRVIGQRSGILRFQDVLFENVWLAFDVTNSGRREVVNCTFRLGETPASAFSLITAGRFRYNSTSIGMSEDGVGLIVDGVKVELGFTVPSGSNFVNLSPFQFGESHITNCVAKGFTNFILCRSQTASGTPKVRIGKNVYDGNITDDDASSHGNLRFYGHLTNSTTYNPGNITQGNQEGTNLTVAGARVGDRAWATFSLDQDGVNLDAYVRADDTVRCIFSNTRSVAVDLASGTLTAYVETAE